MYVESQSRRALERRGIDTRDGVEGVIYDGAGGRHGNVGRGRRGDAAVALEGVVAGLMEGRRKRSRDDGDQDDGGEAQEEAMDISEG